MNVIIDCFGHWCAVNHPQDWPVIPTANVSLKTPHLLPLHRGDSCYSSLYFGQAATMSIILDSWYRKKAQTISLQGHKAVPGNTHDSCESLVKHMILGNGMFQSDHQYLAAHPSTCKSPCNSTHLNLMRVAAPLCPVSSRILPHRVHEPPYELKLRSFEAAVTRDYLPHTRIDKHSKMSVTGSYSL